MLIIRVTQQNQISITLFCQNLQQHWSQNFAHRFVSLSRDELSRLALTAVQEAQNKGLESEEDIIIYSDLCLVSNSGFAANLKKLEKNNG